ncbi:YciI family protein [Candidatus Bipolaricaulota bacterium]
MPSQYLYRIHPTRDGFLIESTPEEDAIVDAHFHYLKDLCEQGIVLMAGRTLHTGSSSHGLVVLTADSEQRARSIMEDDPAVVAGVFRAELFPFSVALVGEKILPT